MSLADDADFDPSSITVYIVANVTASTEAWSGMLSKTNGAWTQGWGFLKTMQPTT